MKADTFPVKAAGTAIGVLFAGIILVADSPVCAEEVLMDRPPGTYSPSEIICSDSGSSNGGTSATGNSGGSENNGIGTYGDNTVTNSTSTPAAGDDSSTGISGTSADAGKTDTNPVSDPPISVTGQKYEGTGTAVDYVEDASKVFYTIETADDKVFYLIIDKEKTSNNTYFLREINEDEMKLTEAAVSTPVPVSAETVPKKSSGISAPLVGIVLLGGLGGAYYLIRKKSKDNEEEYEDNILPDPDDGNSGSEGYDPDSDPSDESYENEDEYMLYSIPGLISTENTEVHPDHVVMHNYGPYGPHPDYSEIFQRSVS